jgi:hypothetical protein
VKDNVIGYAYYFIMCVSGANFFKDIRTYNNILYGFFKEAAIAQGLLEDDREILSCLRESTCIQNGRALHELFALVLAINTPATPNEIWQEFMVFFQKIYCILNNK